MKTVSNYGYTVRAKVINRELPSFGKVVNIVRKVNRQTYQVEFSYGGKTFYMNIDNLEII